MNKLKKYAALFFLLPAIANAQADISLLKQSVTERDAEKIKSLIDEGINVNERDENGDTLFYYAVKHKAPLAVLQILSDSGADVNAPSSESGMTPLVYLAQTAERMQQVILQKLSHADSSERQKIEAELKEKADKNMRYAAKIMGFLIAKGANVNQITPFGTALMNAAKSPWNKDIIALLLKSGADVNQLDRDGRSALFYAEAYADNEVVMQLLSADADPEIKDKNGKTYLEISKEYLQQP